LRIVDDAIENDIRIDGIGDQVHWLVAFERPAHIFALPGSQFAFAAKQPEVALMASTPEDEVFMRIAIAEAAQGDLPFGAVIVGNKKVLEVGRNLARTTNDPTAHAEMVVIRRFVATRPASQFQGTTLYTSGESCPMCMGAILWCGISRVVFGASIDQLATKIEQIMLTDRMVAEAAPFAKIAITGGVLAAESLALFLK
jgi:tRNA(adenine34) deaminase